MTSGFSDFEALLVRTDSPSVNTPASELRSWRTELVRASVLVSYSLGVLSLDIDILTRSLTLPDLDILQVLVEELPRALASGWVGGGWTLSPDAFASVAAAAELSIDQIEELLDIHGEMASAELDNREVVRELLERMDQARKTLLGIRARIEQRVSSIQNVMRQHYEGGSATTDDWL